MTKQTFAEVITVIEKAFSVTLDAEARKVWWALLHELDDAVAMAACLDCCRTSTYPPKPADIWTRCQKSEAVLITEAAQAWRMILACAEDYDWQSRRILRGMLSEQAPDMDEDDIFAALETVGDLKGLSEMDHRGRLMAGREFQRVYLASIEAKGHRERKKQALEHVLAAPQQMKRLTGRNGSIDDVAAEQDRDRGRRL